MDSGKKTIFEKAAFESYNIIFNLVKLIVQCGNIDFNFDNMPVNIDDVIL